MKMIIRILTLVCIFSAFANSQSNNNFPNNQKVAMHEFVLTSKALATELALMAAPTSTDDGCGLCVANGWQACGTTCGERGDCSNLQKCMDDVVVMCATLGKCSNPLPQQPPPN